MTMPTMTPQSMPFMTLMGPLTRRANLAAAVVLSAALLSACGSGGSDLPPGSPVGSVSGQYAQQCSPNNPYRADSDAGLNPSEAPQSVEKQWLRAYVNEAYLWYSRVPTVDPGAAAFSDDTPAGHYASLDAYLLALTTTSDDRYSTTYPTRAWKLLSEGGIVLGYGADFARVGSARRIAYVEPGGPAATAGLQRGDTVTSIDGQPVADLSDATIDAALLPASAATHDFGFTRGGTTNVSARLTAAAIRMSPVPSTTVIDTASGRVGYLLFNEHVLTAENALVGAIQGLQAQGISDLVLDLRYNNGGYAYIASQLGYMVAGANRTASRIFERQEYNDKRIAETNSRASSSPFFSVKCVPDVPRSFACTSSDVLPTLALPRVWVLAGPDTRSASESLINGLRGIDVTVHLIGATTGGQPYQYKAKDNCGISYFVVESKGVNAKNFGDYGAGFTPTCQAADDFEHALGNASETLLATALAHRATGACPAISATATSAPGPVRRLAAPARGLGIALPTPGLRVPAR